MICGDDECGALLERFSPTKTELRPPAQFDFLERVVLPEAATGIEVLGTDASAAMLDRAPEGGSS